MIETVITPREGCKLVIRSSKGNGQEEFYVDSIEVVSFGNSIFYRSSERPKSFLLPVSDYEVLELKETRMALKSTGVERSIKIGSSPSPRPEKLSAPIEAQEPSLPAQEKAPSQGGMDQHSQGGGGRKRDKRRSRRRGRGMDGKDEMMERGPQAKAPSHEESSPTPEAGPQTMISRLFPPPPTLIKEKLNRYKDTAVLEANLISEGEKLSSPAPDVMEFGKDQGFFRGEDSKEESLPEDLEPHRRGPRDEPVYDPESYEEEHPTTKIDEEIPEQDKDE